MYVLCIAQVIYWWLSLSCVGRLLAGWLADHPRINVVWINATALFIGGITNWLFTVTANYYLLAAEAIVFGLCMGK